MAVAALQLLKSPTEELEWRVTIQSDAMAIIDFAQQKTERTEFLNAVATFLQSAATVGQNSPELIPMMGTLLQFGVAGFRVGKDVEGAIDMAIKQIAAEIEQKKANPQPSPEQVKAEADMKAKQQDAALKQQTAEADLQRKEREFMMEMKQRQAEFMMEMKMMMQEHMLKMQTDREAAAQKASQQAIANAQKMSQQSREAEDGTV
jgi:hypothetical protein